MARDRTDNKEARCYKVKLERHADLKKHMHRSGETIGPTEIQGLLADTDNE